MCVCAASHRSIPRRPRWLDKGDRGRPWPVEVPWVSVINRPSSAVFACRWWRSSSVSMSETRLGVNTRSESASSTIALVCSRGRFFDLQVLTLLARRWWCLKAPNTHRRPLTQARRGVRGRRNRSVTRIIRRAALRRSRYEKDESNPPVVHERNPDASTCEGAWASFIPRSRARTRVLTVRARVDPSGSRENRGVPVADVLSARPRPTSGQRLRSERCACQVRQSGRNRYAGC